MKISTAIAGALIALTASVEAQEVFILGDSTTSHYDYSSWWNDSATTETTKHYILQNQLFAWGMFAKEYAPSTLKYWNLGKGGISTRSWWWQFGTSDCVWPAVKNSVRDANTASSSTTGHSAYQVIGQPSWCPTTTPQTGDYVVIQLGINDNSEWFGSAKPNGMYGMTDATLIKKILTEERAAASPTYRISPDVDLAHVISSDAISGYTYDEIVRDYTTYVKGLISSVVCRQNSGNYGQLKGAGSYNSSFTPQKMLDNLIKYDQAGCSYTGVKVVLMTDNFKAGQFWQAGPNWIDRLNAVRTDFNTRSVMRGSYQIPAVANGWLYQKRLFNDFAVGNFMSTGADLSSTNFRNFFFSSGFTLENGIFPKDSTHPNFFGARLSALANMCALRDSNAALVDSTKLPTALCARLNGSSTLPADALGNAISQLGWPFQNRTVTANGITSTSFAIALPASLPKYGP